MEGNNGKGEFQYTYSAREQAELRRIREKYTGGREENKMERLRRLDAGVTQKAQAVSLIIGVLGALILGLGMSLIMTDLGTSIGLSDRLSMPLGIVIGIFGCVPVSLAYPAYSWVLKREKGKIAPEILRLTEELMK